MKGGTAIETRVVPPFLGSDTAETRTAVIERILYKQVHLLARELCWPMPNAYWRHGSTTRAFKPGIRKQTSSSMMEPSGSSWS
jgi:hypothetical protein